MPPANKQDPQAAFRFRVEIEGIPVAGFSEASGLGVEITPIDYREGNEDIVMRKIPGLRKYANITLKRGLTDSLDLWNWIRSVGLGEPDRRNGAIILLNQKGEPVLRFRFRNGWPCKWEASPLSAKNNEVAIETLEICHEGLEVE